MLVSQTNLTEFKTHEQRVKLNWIFQFQKRTTKGEKQSLLIHY
jgi:hypothetical protein